MKNKKSKVETKKTKLNKARNINKKMQKQIKTTKLLNEKTYIIFLRCTSHFKLQNLHMARGGGKGTSPQQTIATQGEEQQTTTSSINIREGEVNT